MTRDEYVECLKGLLSRDASRIRDANRTLFQAVVYSAASEYPGSDENRTADLVLAEVAAG